MKEVVVLVLLVAFFVALGEQVEKKEAVAFTCKGESCTLDQGDEEWRFATRAVHADDGIESNIADVAPPIHLTTTFRADNKEGLVYSRTDSPTRKRAEKVLGELEGPNNHAVLYASGLAATHALLAYLQPHRVALPKGYHGTRLVLEEYRRQRRSSTKDGDEDGLIVMDIDDIRDDDSTTTTTTTTTTKDVHVVGKGDLIWLETPINPTCTLYDIQKYAAIAHRVGAFLAVDSTFASPVLQKPLDLDADFVFHSCTKYLGGHSDILMGALVVKDISVADKLRSLRTIYGDVPGSLETFLLLRSMRTLSLRVMKQSENSFLLATFLSNHKQVAKVHHPGLPHHPDHELAKKQMTSPSPPCFSIELHTEEAARRLPSHLKLFVEATSLGGVESMIDWRRRYDPHISPTLLRISVGIEDPDDLIHDMQQALDKI